ncbi:MAG: hypothetical protein U1E75_08350 [Alicycliphilus sp.]
MRKGITEAVQTGKNTIPAIAPPLPGTWQVLRLTRYGIYYHHLWRTIDGGGDSYIEPNRLTRSKLPFLLGLRPHQLAGSFTVARLLTSCALCKGQY